jgi:glyoxylase-like metal-dependent hydrolase (beta-lactamase superfamily II)
VVAPTEVFEGEKVIDAGDCTIRLYTTGPGEDTEHVVAYIPEHKILLPNDLIYNGWHPWNELERDGHWLRIIDWLRTFDADTIVPGHGPVCGPEIYDVMERWLRTFQGLRAKYAGRNSIKDMPPENRRKMMEELKALHPDWHDTEIPFSCGHVLAVPYSYRVNTFSAEKF